MLFPNTDDNDVFLPVPEEPRRKRKLPVILAIIAGVLVLAITAGLLTNWYGLYGPGTKIILGTGKLLRCESFTLQVETVTQLSIRSDPTTSTSTIQVQMDYDREDLTVVIFEDEGTVTGAIYHGYYIKYLSSKNSYTAKDISDDIEALFDGADNLDLESLLLELGGQELYDSVSITKLKRSLLSLFAKSNNDRWLEENTGFTAQRLDRVTTYTFHPELYRLCGAVLEEFEPAFRDPDDYDAWVDSLEDMESVMDALDVKVSLDLQKGRLTAASMALDTNLIDVSMDMKISKTGTTVINTKNLDSILSKADFKD